VLIVWKRLLVQKELLGVGDGTEDSYDTKNGNIINSSYKLYYGASNDLLELVEDDDFYLSLDDGRSLGEGFVEHYNNNRLHSAIGYIAPFDKLVGNEHRIMEQRNNKLAAARIARKLGGVVLTDKNST